MEDLISDNRVTAYANKAELTNQNVNKRSKQNKLVFYVGTNTHIMVQSSVFA